MVTRAQNSLDSSTTDEAPEDSLSADTRRRRRLLCQTGGIIGEITSIERCRKI